MRIHSSLLGLAAGLLVLVAGFGWANRISEEYVAEHRAQVLRLGVQQGYLLRREIDRSLAATTTLAAVLQETNGQFNEFDGLAARLMETFGGVSSIQLAPNGVIRTAYPPSVAERVIGIDLMADPRGKQAITRAIVERQLALAGPLELSTGDLGWAGYRPVFVTDDSGEEHFWGLVLVMVTLKDLISATGIDRFDRSGYDFALTHVPNNGGESALILRSTVAPVDPVEIPLEMPNGRWILAVAPEGGWPKPHNLDHGRILILALASLVGYIVYELLRRPQQLREQIARRTHELGDANRRLMHEVTSRETAQAALTSVLNAVGDGVVATDESDRIIMANRQIESIFGHRPHEALGKRLADLLPTYTLIPGTGDSMQSGEVSDAPACSPLGRRIETIGVHKSGRRFPVEVYVAETVIGGQVHYTASVRDITRQKELEGLRDDFISTVSHELRTPLASILGWIETLLGGRPGPLNDVQRRFLQLAESSANRLDRLVEELLTVARIDRGALRMHMRPFEPGEALQASVDMLSAVATERQISFIVIDNWPAHKPIVGDRERVEQVLTNLLSNAVKFSPDGSVVIVRSDQVEGQWRVEIEDQGIGVPAAEIPSLFQRFYRASTAIASQIQGTGLGLYVCKAIVEGHQGKIGLVSREGEGTTVWFTLPAHVPTDNDALWPDGADEYAPSPAEPISSTWPA